MECAVCNVECGVCSVECAVCSVQCGVCSVHSIRTLFSNCNEPARSCFKRLTV